MDNTDRPEDTEDAVPAPVATCKPCESKWKPTRREIFTGAAALTAAGLMMMSASPALADDPIGPCEEAYQICMAAIPPVVLACNAGCAGLPSIPREICEMGCDIAMLEMSAACALARTACLAKPVVDALAQAAELIVAGLIAVGAVIIIGGVIIAIIACITGTGGACAVVLLAAV
jgi:hypothetical protein